MNKFIDVRSKKDSMDVMVVKRRHLETRGGRRRQLEADLVVEETPLEDENRSKNHRREEKFYNFLEKVSQKYEVIMTIQDTSDALEDSQKDLEDVGDAQEDVGDAQKVL